MTTIQIKATDYGTTFAAVNGRRVADNRRIEMIENVSAGKWVGIAFDEEFEIIGGKQSGGASNEWFVKCPMLFGDQHIFVKSAAEAVRMIENS